jgi:hypothetical protein
MYGVIAYLTLIILAMKKQPQTNPPSNKTEQQNTNSERDAIVITCTSPPLSDEERAEKNEEKTRNRRKFRLEKAGFIVLLFYTLFTGFMAWQMKESTTATQTAANATKRSVEISEAQAREQYGTPDIGLFSWLGLYHLGEGKKLAAIVVIQNNGKGEAKSVNIAGSVDFRESRPQQGPDGYDFPNSAFEPIGNLKQFAPAKPNDQPPNMVARVTKIRLNPTSPEEYRDYKSGKTKLFIWGQVRYSDFLQKPHIMPFCKWIGVNNLLATTGADDGFSAGYNDCNVFVKK